MLKISVSQFDATVKNSTRGCATPQDLWKVANGYNRPKSILVEDIDKRISRIDEDNANEGSKDIDEFEYRLSIIRYSIQLLDHITGRRESFFFENELEQKLAFMRNDLARATPQPT